MSRILSSSSTLVFIDSAVEDHETLFTGLAFNTEVVLLDTATNGLQQIADYLSGYSNLDAVHIVSHGAPAALQLGDTFLTLANLEDYRMVLSQVGRSLSPGGDILLWGCNVAQGIAGGQFIQELATLTGAAIAASEDVSGLDGDWVLEKSAGNVAQESLRLMQGTFEAAEYSRSLLVKSGGSGNDSLKGLDDQSNSLYGLGGDDTLEGGNLNDLLYGGTGNDLLLGREGQNHLFGEDGNDYLSGRSGDDSLDGGLGHDTLYGGNGGNDTLIGGLGDDELSVGSGLGNRNLLDGGEGNDTLYGNAGSDDTLLGGDGNDLLIARNSGSDNDSLDGGSGNDNLRATGGNSTLNGGGGADSLFGSFGDDRLLGGPGADQITSYSGDNTLRGGAGNDALSSGDGNNIIYGEGGDDGLQGGSGDDFLDGGLGSDVLFGNGGNDTLIGGKGNDTLIASSAGQIGDVSLVGGDGNDYLTAGNGNNTLIGGAGADTLLGYHADPLLGSSVTDTAVFAGKRSEYTLYNNPSASWELLVKHKASGVVDSMQLVEWLQFDDVTVPANAQLNTGILKIGFNRKDWTKQSDGTYTASGKTTLGLLSGTQKMLSVTRGSYTLSDTHLAISGTFNSVIDGKIRPLFSGRIKLNFSTGKGSVTPTKNLFEAAGLAPNITGLNLAANDVRLRYSTWGLPQGLANSSLALSPDTLVIDNNGPRLGVTGSVAFPNQAFDLKKVLAVKATGWNVSYDATADTFAILGRFEINPGVSSLKLPAISAEFTGDGLVIVNGKVKDVALGMELGKFAIKGWGFDDVAFNMDTSTNTIAGKGKLTLPFAKGTAGIAANLAFTIKPFEVNKAKLTVALPAPIPVLTTGWSITSLGGGLSNMASTVKKPVLLTGEVGLASPGKIATMILTGELDKDHVTGKVAGKVISRELLRFNGNSSLNWRQDTIKVSSKANFLKGTVTGGLNFLTDFNFNITAKGNARVNLKKVLGRNLKLAGNYYLKFTNDNVRKNDYVTAWATSKVSLLGLKTVTLTQGLKYSFDGQWSTFGAKDVPLYSSWVVDTRVKDLLVDVKWENEASKTVKTRVVVYDDLAKTQVRQVIDEADYAANGIAVIKEWSNATGKVVYIGKPTEGLWDVEVVNPAGLGKISYSATTSYKPNKLSIENATLNNFLVKIDYTAINRNSKAKLQFFLDDDDLGYDGKLIASKTELNGKGLVTWTVKDLEPGRYWVYATMEDGKSLPADAYAGKAIEIGALLSGTAKNDLLKGSAYADNLNGMDGNDQLLGLGGKDTLLGGAGNDLLVGAAGSDSLTGGKGRDRYRWINAAEGGDRISDFSRAEGDKLQVMGKNFKGLAKGRLSTANFVANAQGVAKDANDYFIYNTISRTLYFDSNGSQAGGRRKLATFGNNLLLKHSDITVV